MAMRDKLESFRIGQTVQDETPQYIKTSGTMRFVSLHHHSTFSYLDGYGLPEEHIARAAELGYTAMALTEHGNVSSHARLEESAERVGVKPIFGCELYTGYTDEDRRTQRKNHLTVLAATQQGYRNLMSVVTRSWAEGFYYEPTTNSEMLKEHREGLIILSGCTGSLLATSLIGGKNIKEEDASLELATKVAKGFRNAFGDAFYLEVQAFPELEATRALNPVYEELSQSLDIPLAATADVHYCQPTDNEMQRILHNVRGGGRKSLEQQSQEFEYSIKLSHPTDDNILYKRLRGTGLSKQAAINAINNTSEISSRCDISLPRADMIRYPLPHGENSSVKLFRKWINEGWNYRGFNKLSPSERKRCIDRIRYECGIMEEKDFVDYFLVVSEVVKWAKDSGIPVGPARGSAAGSLVCYLLRITEVNPMLFDALVFERFIDKTREDLPDIDLDFDDELRGRIREFLVSRYGADRVGNIGTFTKYKGKNSLDDVARVYKVPQWEVNKVKELMVERSGGDLRASATIEDTVEMFDQAADVFERFPELNKSMKLEGNYKGMGVHAGGHVVATRPLTDICAVYTRESKGVLTEVIAYDKYDAERMGLLKMDFLSLTTIGAIRIMLEETGVTLEELYNLPLDIPEVYEGFRDNDVVGVFQFAGRSMRSINGALKPDNFQELCDVNALARPGPLHNGASSEYIDVKQGAKEPELIHPMLEEITKSTNYQIVYQEQILRICMELGGFDWTHSAYIRKIISRRLGEQEFNRQGGRFIKGAQERGISEEDAKRIWGMCITAGAYAFNAAHCVSYGMIAYWCMWFKRVHPHAFYVGSLSKAHDDRATIQLLRDTKNFGRDIKVLPPSPTNSGVGWKAENSSVRAGFSQIPGVGEKTAKSMLEYRNNEEVEDWDSYVAVRGIGPKTIASIKEFSDKEDPFGVYALERKLDKVRSALEEGVYGPDGRMLPNPTHTSIEVPYTKGPDVEVVWVGQILHRNLRELFEYNMSRTGEPPDPETVKRPDLNEWVIMHGEDETELLGITIDRFRYRSFKQTVWGTDLEKDVVLIRGVKKGFVTNRMIHVTEFTVLDPE